MNQRQIKVGDKVLVVGSDSIPAAFLGWEGEVTGFFGEKAMVLLIPREGAAGSLSHTAFVTDLMLLQWEQGEKE